MIQRIQSIWLLIASVLSGLLMIDWYTGYVYKADVPHGLGSIVNYLRITDHFPSLLIAVVMIALPLVAIFFFKNRKRQRSLSWMGILACIAFIAVSLMHIENFKNTSPMPRNGSYQAGIVVPVVAIVFLYMAINGIKHDEKLVRSADRLR